MCLADLSTASQPPIVPRGSPLPHVSSFGACLCGAHPATHRLAFVQDDDRRIAEAQYKRCMALQFWSGGGALQGRGRQRHNLLVLLLLLLLPVLVPLLLPAAHSWPGAGKPILLMAWPAPSCSNRPQEALEAVQVGWVG